MILATLVALLLPWMPTQGPADPILELQWRSGLIHFNVEWERPPAPFVAAVLLSLNPNPRIQFEGVPPVLCDFTVLGAGLANTVFQVHLPENLLPPGMFLYTQGVVADGHVIRATPVVEFILDGSPPSGSGK